MYSIELFVKACMSVDSFLNIADTSSFLLPSKNIFTGFLVMLLYRTISITLSFIAKSTQSNAYCKACLCLA